MPLLQKVAARLRTHGLANSFQYATCRFSLFRSFFRVYHAFFKKRTSHPVDRSMFASLSVPEALGALRKDALFEGPSLSPALVSEILEYARTKPCFASAGGKKAEFLASDRAGAEAALGSKIVLAHFEGVGERCDAVRRIARDPKVLDITAKYLNKDPDRIDARLWWSFATDASQEERLRMSQTVLFHYDLEAYQYLYFNFYVTPTGPENGAHVAVKGATRRSPSPTFSPPRTRPTRRSAAITAKKTSSRSPDPPATASSRIRSASTRRCRRKRPTACSCR